MPQTKRCRGYAKGGIAPHDAQDDTSPQGFPPGKNQCRSCYALYYADWKAKGPQTRGARRTGPDFAAIAAETTEGEEFVSDDDLQTSRSHAFRADPDVLRLWHAVVSGAASGDAPASILFFGPSGSGKTACAQHLASLVGLPFTKVDAASMTDATDWFGTREVIEQNGTSVTVYQPSDFVIALQRPGVLLIDEVTRIRDEHRNIILPLTDGTGRVTNPLTGDVVLRDPKCFIIMSGNRGLQFTGTFAVDPALLTRAFVVDFDYAKKADEEAILMEATGIEKEEAETLVRFGHETRSRARVDAEMMPISTRELLQAAKAIKNGLSMDLAVRFACITSASDEGGAASIRMSLEQIWTGVRKPAAAPASSGPNAVGGSWSCPSCSRVNAASETHCDACGQARA